jgi:hypothetical protein
VIPAPFHERPPAVERRDPVLEQLEQLIAHVALDVEQLQRVHHKQELRRRLERERDHSRQEK